MRGLAAKLGLLLVSALLALVAAELVLKVFDYEYRPMTIVGATPRRPSGGGCASGPPAGR